MRVSGSSFRRKGLHQMVLALFALYTWTVLAFPGRFHPTTSARGFALPTKALSRRFGAGNNHHKAVAAKKGEETTTQQIVEDFLASKRTSPSSLLEQFHVQGWRWHTKSLARDAGRLHKLALKTDPNSATTLKDASDYVVGFNMVGLHRIEANLFFPWMREKLVNNKSSSSSCSPALSEGFSSAMDALESDQRAVVRLGRTISEHAHLACDAQAPPSSRSESIAKVANHSAELQMVVQNMISIEEKVLVPAIGAIVPAREQKSFNNKVLRKLGLLDSRLHLVGMYETVWEDGDSLEKKLFQQAIPGITRQLIPRWRRKLYQPKTYMMEE